jgi:chaperonin GroEL (HSP60 family)
MPWANGMQVLMSERYILPSKFSRSSSNVQNQGLISNILEEDVVQPLLVSTSAIELATETVCLLLKIDDYVQAR